MNITSVNRQARLFVIALLALSGCTSVQVALHLKTRLDKLPVTALAASLSPPSGLAPGRSAWLVVVATTGDGQQLTTEGAGHGKVTFDSFTFDADIARISKNGVVSLPPDPRVSEGKTPHLRITAIGHPDVIADLDIPVRYDVDLETDFSGAAGRNGMDGSNGSDGMSGSDGSYDPNNPSAGGNGSNGGNGGDGDNGGDGQAGRALQVWITPNSDSHPLLQVRVASEEREQLFLIDPNGGSLTVKTNGGVGGRGGSGGQGGRGGSGGIGSPGGQSGFDGTSGSDGFRGREGAAGTIVAFVDPRAQGFLDRFYFFNKSGSGRAGPPPQILIQPVAPLW